MKDHNTGYKPDLLIIGTSSGHLSAGSAVVPITPDVPDRWIDKNNSAEFTIHHTDNSRITNITTEDSQELIKITLDGIHKPHNLNINIKAEPSRLY
jgi:hypothetical protein